MPLPTPDLILAGPIPNDGGIALFDNLSNLIDQAGMSLGSAYIEGTPLAPLVGNIDQSYERKPGGIDGSCQDTNDNVFDFELRIPSDGQNLASPFTPCASACTTTTTTIIPILAACHVVVSEFRSAVPGGDYTEFVELFNPTAYSVDISGWEVWISDDLGNQSLLIIIPSNTLLGSGQHYLIVKDSQTCHVVVSEFRTAVPSGTFEEFIELFNPTAHPVDISGWEIWVSDDIGSQSLLTTVPASTVLASGQHYLVTKTPEISLLYPRHEGTSPDRQYFAGQLRSATYSSTSFTANVHRAYPFLSERNVNVNQLAIRVTSPAGPGMRARLGIYQSISNSNMAPGSLVIDAGEVLIDSVGEKTLNVTQVLNANVMYYFAILLESTVLLQAFDFGGSFTSYHTDLASVTLVGFQVSQAYGVFPGVFQTSGIAVASSPGIVIRARLG